MQRTDEILNTTYYDNYVFDNIEEQFNGITTEFSLKYEEDDIIGIHARNAIITIDSIVQQTKPRFGFTIFLVIIN